MKSVFGGSRLVVLLVLSALAAFMGIRCGGDEGKRFGPTVELLKCPPDTVFYGQLCVFEWRGEDRDGRVVGYYYGLNNDPPETWTTSEACTIMTAPLGRNVFFVQAEDDDGRRSEAVSCVFTVRQSTFHLSPAMLDFGSVDPIPTGPWDNALDFGPGLVYYFLCRRSRTERPVKPGEREDTGVLD